ncbi:ATP-binding cassette domain-containing protein [Vibrio hannami]|uniref:ATP-binding cassette domain-containing protein n=1 Tax=Vibrio hannami TaxID=2717094 RepID=UPI00240F0625|nr:ATP-binding cassette domain-containing protein [Vibrio hannami]MDG3084866.1 ATP-binding cassette domain-containing protein [Vibrio hannami]
MPLLQANNISFRFDNGDTLFKNISCSLTDRRTALIGRNGIGKSLLASLLMGELKPTDGSVVINASLAKYSQLPSQLRDGECTVAEYLQIDEILKAIEQIEAGSCDNHWFELVGDQWDLNNSISKELIEMGLPGDVYTQCKQLSGGQLARLQLWQLFQSDAELLALDEPSNHLDSEGRLWLMEEMRKYSGSIFLISHDRQLLNQMDQIWELSNLGLKRYGGNYDFYYRQKSQDTLALERQIKNVQQQQRFLEEQAQKNKEKAEQRASKGTKARKEGSQAKIILDGMRDSATASAANQSKNERGRREFLKQQSESLNEQYEQVKTQKMYLTGSEMTGKRLVNFIQAQLPFGSSTPINMQVDSNTKLHLQGRNGCGKSTLLRVLLGQERLIGGESNINTSVVYLDQHFSLLEPRLSMLECLMSLCDGLLETDARILLAGIGFRKDTIYRCVDHLSGGEKMKLSMLIVSNQPEQPLLLLDEPDNHLDIDSKCLLASTLNQYKGAFILVSHDEDFVEESGVKQKLLLSR